jgi:hypothetical protein
MPSLASVRRDLGEVRCIHADFPRRLLELRRVYEAAQTWSIRLRATTLLSHVGESQLRSHPCRKKQDSIQMSVVPHTYTSERRAPVADTLGREYCNGERQQFRQPELQANTGKTNTSQSLDLCQTRTYNEALTTLGAYKLTGNFPAELEIALRDLGILDEVTYEIEPKKFSSLLSSVRHVTFRANANVRDERFREIIHLINSRIGVRRPRRARPLELRRACRP